MCYYCYLPRNFVSTFSGGWFLWLISAESSYQNTGGQLISDITNNMSWPSMCQDRPHTTHRAWHWNLKCPGFRANNKNSQTLARISSVTDKYHIWRVVDCREVTRIGSLLEQYKIQQHKLLLYPHALIQFLYNFLCFNLNISNAFSLDFSLTLKHRCRFTKTMTTDCCVWWWESSYWQSETALLTLC